MDSTFIYFKTLVIFLSGFSIIPLFLLLLFIIKNGMKVISIDFLFNLPKPPGESGGGILNSIVGTALLILIASSFSIPTGILIGIFLAEVKNRFTEILRVLANVLQGTPSIVIGIIAYIWIVRPMGGFSAFSGGVALSLMMLPMVIKSTEESLRLIPPYLKEASYALGVSYTRTILKVILPAGLEGIICGVLIGISRVAGETAPLIFTSFGNPFLNINPLKPVDALPLLIFNYAMSPYEDWHRLAWGASFILVILVMALNLIIKVGNKKWKVEF